MFNSIILKCLLFSSLIALFTNCNTDTANNEIRNNTEVSYIIPNWFLGTWINNTADGIFTEKWEQENDSLYHAISTVVVEKDTVFYETVDLLKTKNDWNYVVSVKNQASILRQAQQPNSASVPELPVSFKLTAFTETQLVFENPQHDFPTKITYTQINADSIVAEISGTLEGKVKSELFPMKRVK